MVMGYVAGIGDEAEVYRTVKVANLVSIVDDNSLEVAGIGVGFGKLENFGCRVIGTCEGVYKDW